MCSFCVRQEKEFPGRGCMYPGMAQLCVKKKLKYSSCPYTIRLIKWTEFAYKVFVLIRCYFFVLQKWKRKNPGR